METFSLTMLAARKASRVSLFMVGLVAWQTAAGAQVPLANCASPLVTLGVERPLRSVVLETWRRSLTFRRQVARLADEPTLAVTVRLWVFGRRWDARAQTRFTREVGHLRHAAVEVKPADHTIVELIAHELEHVLEQLDGVDVGRMDGRSGVSVSRHHQGPHVETKRAQMVGRIVAAEYAADQATVDGGCLEARR